MQCSLTRCLVTAYRARMSLGGAFPDQVSLPRSLRSSSADHRLPFCPRDLHPNKTFRLGGSQINNSWRLSIHHIHTSMRECRPTKKTHVLIYSFTIPTHTLLCVLAFQYKPSSRYRLTRPKKRIVVLSAPPPATAFQSTIQPLWNKAARIKTFCMDFSNRFVALASRPQL